MVKKDFEECLIDIFLSVMILVFCAISIVHNVRAAYAPTMNANVAVSYDVMIDPPVISDDMHRAEVRNAAH